MCNQLTSRFAPTDICSVIKVSYQNISLALLSEYLALEGGALLETVSKEGWTVTGEQVQIQNQESTIKSKKILAKIEFDSKS